MNKLIKFLSFISPFIIGACIFAIFDPLDKYEKFLENSKKRGIKRYQKKNYIKKNSKSQ